MWMKIPNRESLIILKPRYQSKVKKKGGGNRAGSGWDETITWA